MQIEASSATGRSQGLISGGGCEGPNFNIQPPPPWGPPLRVAASLVHRCRTQAHFNNLASETWTQATFIGTSLVLWVYSHNCAGDWSDKNLDQPHCPSPLHRSLQSTHLAQSAFSKNFRVRGGSEFWRPSTCKYQVDRPRRQKSAQ